MLFTTVNSELTPIITLVYGKILVDFIVGTGVISHVQEVYGMSGTFDERLRLRIDLGTLKRLDALTTGARQRSEVIRRLIRAEYARKRSIERRALLSAKGTRKG